MNTSAYNVTEQACVGNGCGVFATDRMITKDDEEEEFTDGRSAEYPVYLYRSAVRGVDELYGKRRPIDARDGSDC